MLILFISDKGYHLKDYTYYIEYICNTKASNFTQREYKTIKYI